MKRLLIYGLLYFLIGQLSAQYGCPSGFEMKDVRCSGKIVSTCVPVNYSCSQCWGIEWQNCNGTWSGGGLSWHSTYEKCLEEGQRTENGTMYHDCPGELTNKHVWRIFLDESKFCSGSGASQTTSSNSSNNSQSNYMQEQADKINEARRAEEKKANEERANQQQQENLRRQSEAEQRRLDQEREQENRRQEIADKLARDQNAVNQMSNNVQSALRDVQQQLEDKYEREAAADREAAEDRRQEREEQRLQEQREREEREAKEEEEYQRALAKAERDAQAAKIKRAAELASFNTWKAKATAILPESQKYATVTWPKDNNNQSLKSLFYVVWNFDKYETKGIAIKLVEVKKSPDGDWPLITDICDRIVSETNFTLDHTPAPDYLAAGGNVLHYLLGTFSSLAAGLQARNELKANAIKNGYTVKVIDDVTPQKASNSTNFWKE